MKLFDLYNKIFQDNLLWKYYSGMDDPGPLMFSDDYCIKFINNYLASGLKIQLPNKLPTLRRIHTLSVYFLGLALFYYVFNGNKYPDNARKSFVYYWFLTCFYHDNGYVFEQNQVPLKINDDEFKKILKDILTSLPDSLYLVKDTDVVMNYFENYRGKIDHGIAGAVKIFKALEKNHNELLSRLKCSGSPHEISSCIFPGTNIRLNNTKFPYSAAIIAIHNIWLGKATDAEKYEENGIGSLVGKKYDFNEDALLFWVLQIADTLEPIKKLPDILSTSEIYRLLQSIELDLSPYSISISYKEQICRFDYKSWLSNCAGMKDWTNIDVDDLSENSITLAIPQAK